MKEYFRLLKLLRPYRWLLVLSFILIILFGISNAVSIYLSIPLLRTLFYSGTPAEDPGQAGRISNYFDYMRHEIETFIFSSGNKYDALVKVCIMLLTAYFLKNFFGYLHSILTQFVEKSLVTDLRRKLYRKFNSLSLRHFTRRRSGDLISRIISDVNVIQNTVSVTFTDILKQPILIIIFVSMAFFLSWKLTLLSILIIPLSLLLIFHIGKKLKKYSRRVQEKLSDFTSIISETIYGSKVIRAFSMEDFENRKFDVQLRDYFRSIMKSSLYNDLTRPLTEFISVIIGVTIIWYGGREILTGPSLAPEEFIGFLIIIFQLMSPIKDLSTVNNRIQESSSAANRIFEVLDIEAEILESKNSISKNTFDSCIEFKNVSFAYDNKLILNSLNMKINKNERVAIVGLSGVGKSTLVDLMPRFYDASSGEITVDGINIKELKLSSLRGLFGIVTQEILLFNDSIRNNIAYGMQDIPLEKVIEASKNANAHEFIIKTENGYETVIGERGLKLSGGQKQRIAIARALLKNAPIMIFDEATSSLDMESENLIQEAIEKLMRQYTSIVIAHRLSTIRNADRIIVLHDGKINSTGTHEELMREETGIYRKLYEMQFN